MRLALVNHLHPDSPLVGAARLREFAHALARRGHHVVLLTEAIAGREGDEPATLVARLAEHDWTRPLMVSTRARRVPLLDALRQGRLPRPLRALVIAGLYLARGGVFPDWSLGVAPLLPVLAGHFRPQAVWGTFGNTDAWIIARSLARRAGCPWVMDVKDKWDVFIPAPLRAYLAWRFNDAARLTALARSYLDHVRPRFSCPGTVIYSGVSQALLDQPAHGAAEDRLTLSGSTYSPATLSAVMAGIAGAVRPGTIFTYAGTDHRQVAEAARSLPCAVDIRGQLPQDELVALQRPSFANLYCCIGDHDRFHSKLIELLCVGRPILCLPPDGPEADSIARQVTGDFTGCATPEDLARALSQAWDRRQAPVPADGERLAAYGWDGQAALLEEVFEQVIPPNRRTEFSVRR
ncbi:hypothetical protein H261_14030 [Paramagnetospirillum caucaseum]|uniref:Glycosyltransferase subfamily 4-like N-terminal domain-containing protein n=1 Tax=Paramagnetospirillum caucaseum TaxID=1244869 RepID=M2Z4Q2_9PROT|nr:hypothetical protein [Paramagnetospirillum caucaseum]EME69340.1 hypothetical protein H261_14030 [Paramagnetospirillum caucaseum]